MSYIHIDGGGRNIGVVIINLTEKEKCFVDGLLEHGDMLSAYKKAYKTKGLSDKAVFERAKKLAAREKVANSIEKLKGDPASKRDITAVDIMDELSSIAFSDISDYVVIEGGEVKPIPTNMIEPKKMLAVENIKQGSRNIEIKLYDKLKALDMLGRMIGPGKAEASLEQAETIEEFLKKQEEGFRY